MRDRLGVKISFDGDTSARGMAAEEIEKRPAPRDGWTIGAADGAAGIATGATSESAARALQARKR